MRRMYSKEQLQKLIDEVSRLIAIEELDKVVPVPDITKAGYVMVVNAAGTGYQLVSSSAISVDGTTIRPANCYATGDITANSIIENMSGYSATLIENTGYNITPAYCGAVKNGNKITFAFATKIEKTAEAEDSNPYLIEIAIPSAVYNALYTSQIGQSNFLDNKVLKAFSHHRSAVDMYAWLEKKTNNKLALQVNTLNMVAATEYFIRYEATFLLSDSLLPNE